MPPKPLVYKIPGSDVVSDQAIRAAAVRTETRRQAQEHLRECGAVLDGHFSTHHSNYHTSKYYQMDRVIFEGKLWSILQDLVGYIPHEMLEQVTMVAGPEAIGDIMVVNLTHLINGSRSPKLPTVHGVRIKKQFRLVTPELGRTEYSIDEFYDRHLAGAKVLLVDGVYSTGSVMSQCTELLKARGAEVIGRAVILNLAIRPLPPGEPLHSFWEIERTDVYNINDCPMCKRHDPLNRF